MSNSPKSADLIIVDDDNVVLDLLSDLLGRKYHIRCAHDAAEAYKLLNADLCNVLIVDLGLPGMSGVEFIREVRGDSRTAHIPIIAMSAFHELLKSLSCDDVQAVIRKPFSTKQFAQTVEQVLAH